MPITSINPIYGVEPYTPLDVPVDAASGGGADVTQENLLITLWDLPNPGDLSVEGTLIKPLTWIGDGSLVVGRGIRQQAFRSRLSARFQFDATPSEGGTNMLAILQAPNEVREAFLQNGLVTPGGSDGPHLNNGMSLFQGLAWDAFATDLDGDIVDCVFRFSGTPFSGVFESFAKTNGADGVWPEFWPTASEADFAALFNALRVGVPFYIAVIIEPDVTEGFITIRWPFSGGARG